MSPARTCAYTVLRRVFEQGAYADRVMTAEARQLTGRDRALAMQIAYGTVQRRITLDHVAAALLRRRLDRLEPSVLAGLRMGLFQILFLDAIPPHAVVHETVELLKGESPRGAGLANAVLRRASREREALLRALSDATPADAALKHSVPRWMAELWWRELGGVQARALLRHINRPAETALRVNSLLSSRAEVQAALPVAAREAPGLPEGLVLEEPFDIAGSDLFSQGKITPQSRASMLVARTLAPTPRQQVLDLCAAPGAKTSHLGALMGDRGRIVAVERHPGRARTLEDTCRRLGVSSAEVVTRDALDVGGCGDFDRVLLDPPCSGLGTLQSRPDRRWRATAQAIPQLAALQARLLGVAASATRPGGRLVYSICTISDREGPDVIESFLGGAPGWTAEDLGARHPGWRHPTHRRYLQLLPHRDGTDGFFIASLTRDTSDG